MNEQPKKAILIPSCVLTPGSRFCLNRPQEEIQEIIKVIQDSQTQVIQLPCPHMQALISEAEQLHPLLGRNTLSSNQHNKEAQLLFGRLLTPIMSELKVYQKANTLLTAIIGVKGSPYCSVKATNSKLNENAGLFIANLLEKLDKNADMLQQINI